MRNLRVLAACVVVAISVGAGTVMAAEPPADQAPKYDFLRGTQWYVPDTTLPAVLLNLQNGKVTALVDQTVWDIVSSDHGYFWGRAVTVVRPWGSSTTSGNPSCARMVGSVTPDGHVYITFVDANQSTSAGAARGLGTLTTSSAAWRFEMQMSTGATGVVSHWSYMDQCKSGQACQKKLPGTDLSLSQFLAQCP